jgi:hypothetical protein
MAKVEVQELQSALARDAIPRQGREADLKLAEMIRQYRDDPAQKLERDRAHLADLRNDPYHLNKVLGGSIKAANEEAMLAARIYDAEARAERERLAMPATAATANPAAGEVTYGSQIPARDLADAVSTLVEHGVRPDLVETFLNTGHGDDPQGREVEIAAAREWQRRLLADPELQRRFLARDPVLMRQFACFAVYSAGPHER